MLVAWPICSGLPRRMLCSMYWSMGQPVRGLRACRMASSAMAPSASGGTTRTAHGPCSSDHTGTKAAALRCNNGWWRGPPRVGGSGPALRGQSHHGPRPAKSGCKEAALQQGHTGFLRRMAPAPVGPRPPGGGSSGRCHGALWGQQKTAVGVGVCLNRFAHGRAV
jgi:hypothetical protein